MTVRAVALGILLALAVAGTTYINDWGIGQTNLVGKHLPISVFGDGPVDTICARDRMPQDATCTHPR